MSTISMLDELQNRARKEESLRNRFLSTRSDPNPVSAFCRTCQELGYPIYEMDLIQAGEEFYASMKQMCIRDRYEYYACSGSPGDDF